MLKDSEAGMKDALSGISACGWHLAKLCAPKEVVVRESVLSEEEVSRGTRRLADAVKLREERFGQLTRHAIAVHPEEEERMRVAGENAEELTAFLEKDDNPDRKKLLDSLTKKDNKICGQKCWKTTCQQSAAVGRKIYMCRIFCVPESGWKKSALTEVTFAVC